MRRSADGFTMHLNAQEEELISRIFESYLTEYHHGDILKIIADADEETHQAVVVDAMQLFEVSMEVGDYFNAYPTAVLAIFDKVLHKTTMTLSRSASPVHVGGQGSKEQRLTLHTRITGLPVCPELTRDTIPRSSDVGRFLSVTGTVIRTGVAKVLEYERDYICSKCRHVFEVLADFEQYYTFVPPAACPNPDGCASSKFSCLSGGAEPVACRDYQTIKIQEQVQKLSVGSIPRSLSVVLEDDLVDCCKSGDDVTVFGVLHQCWKPLYNGGHCDVELVLKANNVEVNNQQDTNALLMEVVEREFEEFWDGYKYDPVAGRNQILLSLCPQVFGMYVIKLAVAMVLAGGVQRIDSSGTRIRGECHMLLVGDPGTGKSQFLKYAAKIMPRSVLTAGIGSTSAGLTVAAVKDGGDWHLEAGALVLSDGGLCCIDEFNSIKEHDRISIHEAMEQQSISVAKAGMVCKLNTRTTILAATNPKGQYDPNEPLSVNVALASPLLSRFDLVLVLLDTRNSEWDRTISSFILENRGRGMPSESSSLWSMEKIKAYFCVIKQLQPQVSEDANCILTKYYQLQRRNEGRSAARTTIRMLESLSRLAEAHARLMYRQTVTIEDAVMAVSVMECSMQGGELLGNVNAILTSFPADPAQQYQTQCRVLLEGLNLPQIYEKEMHRLARLKNKTSPMSASLDQTDHHHPLPPSSPLHTTRPDRETHSRSESGLDWFNSLVPSGSPNEISSPEFSSTQKINDGKSSDIEMCEPRGETARGFLRNLSSSTRRDTASNAFVTSGSGDKIRKTSKISEENLEREKSSGCVIQKVSGSVHKKRVRDLQYGGGGGGGEDSGNNVIRVLEETFNTGSRPSSRKNPSSNDPGDEDHGIPTVAGQEQPRRKGLTTVLREKMSAQVDQGEDIQAKLSGFSFKPRKKKPSLLHQERRPSSDTSTDFQTQCDTNRESGETRQEEGSHNESGGPLTQNRGQKTQSPDQEEETTGLLGKAVSSSMKDTSPFPTGGVDDSQSLCRKERVDGDETRFPFRSSSSSRSNSSVASSTLAKLSRFSFLSSSEATDAGRTAPQGTERDQSLETRFGEVKSLNSAECGGPSRKKLQSAEPTRSPGSTAPTCGGKIIPFAPTDGSQNHNDRRRKAGELPVECPGSDKQRKRKCFELRPPAPSLFHSAQTLDDVLDTDWEREVSKRAKV